MDVIRSAANDAAVMNSQHNQFRQSHAAAASQQMMGGQVHQSQNPIMADGIVLGIPHNVGGEPQDMSHLSPVFMSAPSMNMLAA